MSILIFFSFFEIFKIFKTHRVILKNHIFGYLQNKVGRFNVIDCGNVRYAHHFFVFDLARSKFFSRYSQYFFGYLANIFSTHFTRSTPLGTPEGTPPRSVPLVPFVSKSLLRQPKKIARNEKTLTVARNKKKRWSHLYNVLVCSCVLPRTCTSV